MRVKLFYEGKDNVSISKLYDIFTGSKCAHGLIHLYLYICKHGTRKNDKIQFDSTDQSIANAIGLSRRTVLRYKEELSHLKLVETERHQHFTTWTALPIVTSDNSEVTEELRSDTTVTSENSIVPGDLGYDVNIVTNLRTPMLHTSKPRIQTLRTQTLPKSNVRKENLCTRISYQEVLLAEEVTPSGPKLPQDPPKMTDSIKELAEATQEFPYNKIPVQSSAIWYWAIQRYKMHGLDFKFTNSSFGELVAKFAKNVIKNLGKDWNKLQEYLEWYLHSRDDFISKEVKWGPHYMTSAHCVNSFLDTRSDRVNIVGEEERKTIGRRL